jgi:hypothetical protein
MSGLEVLAAFGLACNVMQVIAFASETASVCMNIYHKGQYDGDLAGVVAGSIKFCRELETTLRTVPKPLNSDEQQFLDVATQTLAAAQELEAELRKISRESGKGRVGAAIRIGVMARWKTRRIQKLEKSLQDYQRMLESHILLHVWYDALSLYMLVVPLI